MKRSGVIRNHCSTCQDIPLHNLILITSVIVKGVLGIGKNLDKIYKYIKTYKNWEK